MSIIPGFRGTVRFVGDNFDFYFRVSNIDIQVNREAQPFLPVYGGKDLKRIWHTGTGDISINFNAPLVEGLFERLYTIARDPLPFRVDITYYGGAGRRANDCIVNTFSVTCDSGEVATFNMNLIAKSAEEFTDEDGRSYTKGEKLITWDKCSVTFPNGAEGFLGQFVQSFSYNVNNDIKSVKTSASLFPSVLALGIQDVSGQIVFYDIVFPHPGTREYALGFLDTTFSIENINISHEIVFHPKQNIPLVPGPVLSTVTWVKSDDDFTQEEQGEEP